MDSILEDWPKYLTALIAVISLPITIFLGILNRKVSIRQTLLTIIKEKAKDCNTVFTSTVGVNEKNKPEFPHFLVITELVISIEVIDGVFKIFNGQFFKIAPANFFELFYKQLSPDVRGFLKYSPNTEAYKENDYYTKQVNDVTSKLDRYFEKVIKKALPSSTISQ